MSLPKLLTFSLFSTVPLVFPAILVWRPSPSYSTLRLRSPSWEWCSMLWWFHLSGFSVLSGKSPLKW